MHTHALHFVLGTGWLRSTAQQSVPAALEVQQRSRTHPHCMVCYVHPTTRRAAATAACIPGGKRAQLLRRSQSAHDIQPSPDQQLHNSKPLRATLKLPGSLTPHNGCCSKESTPRAEATAAAFQPVRSLPWRGCRPSSAGAFLRHSVHNKHSAAARLQPRGAHDPAR